MSELTLAQCYGKPPDPLPTVVWLAGPDRWLQQDLIASWLKKLPHQLVRRSLVEFVRQRSEWQQAELFSPASFFVVSGVEEAKVGRGPLGWEEVKEAKEIEMGAVLRALPAASAHTFCFLSTHDAQERDEKRKMETMRKAVAKERPDALILSCELRGKLLVSYLRMKGKHSGVALTPEAMELLVQSTGEKPALACRELEKLALLYPNREVAAADVETAVFPSESLRAPQLFHLGIAGRKAAVAELVNTVHLQPQLLPRLVGLMSYQAKEHLRRLPPRERARQEALIFETLGELDKRLKGWYWPKEYDRFDMLSLMLQLSDDLR